MNTKILLLSLALAVLSGCVSGSGVVTGTARPAALASNVKLYNAMPEKCEIIGIVDARALEVAGLNTAVESAKRHAAKMGANGIVLSEPSHSINGVCIEGKAIFVP